MSLKALQKKCIFGQYFTEGAEWLKPQVKSFISKCKCLIAYDPFTGSGCMLSLVKRQFKAIKDIKGLDIDESLGWGNK